VNTNERRECQIASHRVFIVETTQIFQEFLPNPTFRQKKFDVVSNWRIFVTFEFKFIYRNENVILYRRVFFVRIENSPKDDLLGVHRIVSFYHINVRRAININHAISLCRVKILKKWSASTKNGSPPTKIRNSRIFSFLENSVRVVSGGRAIINLQRLRKW